jgi:hypothetical protein
MRQAFALFPFLLLLLTTAASATDIQCDRTQQPGQRVVCDYAILSHEYENLYEQQRTLVESGRLPPNVVADWRRKRDACRDPHCMDGVFAEWDSIAKNVQNVAVAPAITASEALGPASVPGAASATGPASASSASSALPGSPGASAPVGDASPLASGVPVSRQGSAFGVALPQAVQSDASASAPAGPPSAASAASTVRTGAATGLLVVPIVILLVIAMLVVAGIVWYQRRRASPKP